MKFEDFRKPEVIPGLKFWKNEKNKFNIAMLHYTADEKKDPKREGKEWYEKEREGTLKATWEKEYEIDFTTKSGKLVYGPDYCDFNPDIHFINSFEWPEPAELMISLDFGQRNPTAALIGVWTTDQVLYIVDEYYNPALPSVSSREMFKQFHYLFPQYDLNTRSYRQKREQKEFSASRRWLRPETRALRLLRQSISLAKSRSAQRKRAPRLRPRKENSQTDF